MQIRNYGQTNSLYYSSFKKENAKKTEADSSTFSNKAEKRKEVAETSAVYKKEVKDEWRLVADLSHKCGPNEIVVTDDGDFIELGINVVMSRLRGLDKTPFSIQEDKGFSNMPNGIGLVPGREVKLPDGTVLKWTKNGVDYIPRRTGNMGDSATALEYASRIANTMNRFTRVANGQALRVGNIIGITKEKAREISEVLSAMGIDTSRDFYVNGKKFTFDSKSGEFKYDLESSSDSGYSVRYVKSKPIRLAEKRKIKLNA